MTIHRVVPDIQSEHFDESCDFYVNVLGFTVGMDMKWIMTFVSPTNPTAQITIIQRDPSGIQPNFSVEVGDVDAVHAAAIERSLQIVYPLTDEPWGVRRFFVVDPNGQIINVMSHRK